MVYIVVSLSVLIVIAAATFSFAGCSSSKETPDFVGMSLSQSHMDYSECYSFYLRAEDDKVLFDAQLNFYEEPYNIVLESVEVDKSDFQKLIKLEKKHDIVDHVLKYKKKPSPFLVMDETINITSVYFQDNTDKSADTGGDYEQDLYDFFKNLTLEYKDYSVEDSKN